LKSRIKFGPGVYYVEKNSKTLKRSQTLPRAYVNEIYAKVLSIPQRSQLVVLQGKELEKLIGSRSLTSLQEWGRLTDESLLSYFKAVSTIEPTDVERRSSRKRLRGGEPSSSGSSGYTTAIDVESIEGERSKQQKLEANPLIVYARIGKNGELRDLPVLNQLTMTELIAAIRKEFSDVDGINGEFAVMKEGDLPVTEDTTVSALNQDAMLTVVLKQSHN